MTVQGPSLAAVTLRQTVPKQPFPGGVTTLTAFPVTSGIPGEAVISSQTSILSDGRLQVAVVVGEGASRAKQVRYRLWDGETLVTETERDLSQVPVYVHRLSPPEGANVTRVEAALLDSAGNLIDHFELTP